MSRRVLLVVESSRTVTERLAPSLRALWQVEGPIHPSRMLDEVRLRGPHLVVAEVGDEPRELMAAIEQTMAQAPTPIALVVETPAQRRLVVELLAAGALDVAKLPTSLDDDAQVAALSRQLRLLSGVRVVKHPKGRPRGLKDGAGNQTGTLVAIASSLGGPRALAQLLAGLPKDFAAPIAICQHITVGFTDDLARWLESESGLKVREATHGVEMARSEVYVAPSGAHLVVETGGRFKLEESPPVGGFRPACDVLLSSAAVAFGARAIGVVLTGMGRDGARGLLDIRRRGGHTVVQDQDTCAVFGMPKEAIALGGAELVLPLEDIAGQLVRWVA